MSKALGRWSLLCLVIAACLSNSVAASERDDHGYFTLQDGQGNSITMTGREMDPGDHYIAADNRLYEVEKTVGDIIYVTYVETIELPKISQDLLKAQVGKAKSPGGVVGIYHTHNAESYVPTSGTEAKEDGQGDVLQVGKALANSLEKQGLTVYWSGNSHLPHDGQAYLRSRRTATELLRKGPDTLIDVHRDATPPEVYATEIEGVPTTKVRIVVGRQNQNRTANLEYAKRIKAAGDEFFPGIIEGIFDARGNYNQDLGPKMILLEFGAHTNALEQAEQAAEFFAKVIPAAAGLTASERTEAQRQIGGAAGKSLLWLVVIAVIAVLGFLYIDQGKIGSLKGFFRREAGLGGGDQDDSDGEQ
ncbi:MAG: stage II sporulation protein P [Firmicutes bacterium]|nr:stage II sporulation protein P [Bacillota bacterium]